MNCLYLLVPLLLLQQCMPVTALHEVHWGSIVTSQLIPFYKGITRELMDEAIEYMDTRPDQQGW